MILTGKAKEDFESGIIEILKSKYREEISDKEKAINWIYESNSIIINAHIIEWFREKCFIHLQIFPYGDKKSWCYNLSDILNDPYKIITERLSYMKYKEGREFEKFKSYKEATEQAIIKANEIYNQVNTTSSSVS